MSKLPPDLMTVVTVGLDLAKHIFYVPAVDGADRPVMAKMLRRRDVIPFFASLPRCVVGLEACCSAHHWARELAVVGHDVRLIPPAYVKPYVKRQKE